MIIIVTKLEHKNEKDLRDFIYREKDWNLFMIGDYENYGIETIFQQFWGEFDENGYLIAVLMKYYDSLIFSSIKKDFDVDSFVQLINSMNYKVLSGKKTFLDIFSKNISFKSIKHANYSKLDNESKLFNNILNDNRIILCSEKNIDLLKEVINMTNDIEEFVMNIEYNRILNSIIDKSGRVYTLINENDIIVSAAQITAESSTSGMVVAVCTKPEHRGKGYASQLVTKLCMDLLADNKVLCLFYDNQLAGNIYKRIGFKDIGKWSMLIK